MNDREILAGIKDVLPHYDKLSPGAKERAEAVYWSRVRVTRDLLACVRTSQAFGSVEADDATHLGLDYSDGYEGDFRAFAKQTRVALEGAAQHMRSMIAVGDHLLASLEDDGDDPEIGPAEPGPESPTAPPRPSTHPKSRLGPGLLRLMAGQPTTPGK